MECDVKLPKETFGRLRMASKASKMLPRHPQDGLLASQDAPKTRPRRPQDASKTPPALKSLSASKTPQDALQTPLGRPAGRASRKPPASILDGFLMDFGRENGSKLVASVTLQLYLLKFLARWR